MTRTDRRALFYASVIALGGFLFGFDAVVISGVMPFITPEFGLNEWWVGAIVSAPSLAAIAAALTVGPVADYVGRKKVMITLALLYTVSAVASALAPGASTLFVARLIGGFAFGGIAVGGLGLGLIGIGGGIFLSPIVLLCGWAGARETAGAQAVAERARHGTAAALMSAPRSRS